MTTRRRFLTLMVTAVAAVGMLAGDALLAGKGGGKPVPEPDPGPTLPSVRYQIQFFDSLSQGQDMLLYGSNNFGQAVGYTYHDTDGDGVTDAEVASLYDPQVNPNLAIDLNTIVSGIPEGWRLRRATAINSSGDIAAYLELLGTPELTLQAVMIDMNAVDLETQIITPQLHIIPDAALADYTLSTDMNDFGDIVGRFVRDDGTNGAYVYNFGLYDSSLKTSEPIDLGVSATTAWFQINNPIAGRDAQVVGELEDNTAFRKTLGGAFETFPPFLDEATGNLIDLGVPEDINDAGEFCGDAYAAYPKKNKGSNGEYQNYVMGNSLEMFTTTQTGRPRKINGDGDFVTYQGGLQHRIWGYLNPSDLIDPSDPNAAAWAEIVQTYGYVISDRDTTTDFPLLIGSAILLSGETIGFVLTPVVAQ